MGRLFVVDFDDFDMKKFYVCRVCGTPFARNTDVDWYETLPSDVLERGFVWLSCIKNLSNVVYSVVTQELVSSHLHVIGQQICCLFCSIKVGVKLACRSEMFSGSLDIDALISHWTLFRINGENYDHRMVSPEEWFDSPRPRVGN